MSALEPHAFALSTTSRILKRAFDVLVATVLLILTSWLIALAFVAASIDTRQNGFFLQQRVGRHGRRFRLVKIRTMRDVPGVRTSVTTRSDPRITRLGRLLRVTKLDELPQLVNVLLGQMSLVGPRPDVPGFADRLQGSDRMVLSVRPGITGPASLKYRNEEAILAGVDDPEHYNRTVIFPDKVRINREYVETYRFVKDLGYLCRTALGSRRAAEPTSRQSG
jgi:lipopolysaccharide/colanic/teichoic acid biosynthesis glycosyltransferase